MEQFKQYTFSYFSGTITAPEAEALRRWLKADSAHRNLFRQWEHEWRAQKSAALTDEAWQRFTERATQPAEPIVKPLISPSRRWARYAAAACLLLLLAVPFYFLFRPATKSLAAEYTLRTTGDLQTFYLPDSTLVCLNRYSELIYTEAYGGGYRDVQLTGEGYFDVRKNAASPFRVQANGVQVEVTGTRFNISAYADDTQYRATLLEGGVRVNNAQFQYHLAPGEQVVYTYASQDAVKSNCDAEASIAWMKGRLDYDHISMGELMGRLARIYGKSIEIADDETKMLDVHFVMNDTLPLNDIMDAFAATYHLHISRTDNGYSID